MGILAILGLILVVLGIVWLVTGAPLWGAITIIGLILIGASRGRVAL